MRELWRRIWAYLNCDCGGWDAISDLPRTCRVHPAGGEQR